VTLQRLYCLVVIEVGSRYVTFSGSPRTWMNPWTVQQIRNLLMDLGDHTLTPRASGSWSRTGPGRAVQPIVRCGPGRRQHPSREDPATESKADAYAERFVLTARMEINGPDADPRERYLRKIWPSTSVTTGGGPITAVSSARPDLITLPPISPRCG
jgi:putative transposase